MPSHAELVVKVDRPRDLLEAVEKHELFQKALLLPGYRELYDSTNVQRVYQLIAYFEKQLNKNKEEILDDLTGGGVVFAANLTQEKGALVVIQAKNDKALRRFMDVAIELLDKELERQESKDGVVRRKYQNFDTFTIGKDLSIAIVDAALVVADKPATLKTVLDRYKEGKTIGQVGNFVAARKSAPPKALAWGWIHLEQVRKDKNFQAGLDAAALDPNQIILFGGLASLLKRSPHVSAALLRDGTGYRLGITMPRGRDGMGAIAHMMLPADEHGTLVPLQVPRTIGSSSYFLDLGQFWEKKADILGEKNAAGLDEGEKNIKKLLGGLKLGKLLQSAGTHHRLVFAQQKDSTYKTKPATPFPAFALVVDMRDPSFAKDMNKVFRSGALLATFAVGLSLKEETYLDCDLISYHFSETKKVDFDPDGIRFNFTPTYVTVGDQFVMSATTELARDLIDVLKNEKKQSSPATMRTRLYASGLNEIIRANEDGALTKLILNQAVPPKTAKQELKSLMDWIDQVGQVHFETAYGANDFRYDIVWQPRKK